MSFRSVDFDAIAPLIPFDKTASQVAGRGEHFHWEPSNGDKLHSRDPISYRRPTAQECGHAEFKDLTGAKFGRFTVMGIATEVKSSHGQNWVLRCVCGSYETRKARYIKACVSGDNQHEAMCDWCGNNRRLQLGYHNPKKAAAAAEAIQEMAR